MTRVSQLGFTTIGPGGRGTKCRESPLPFFHKKRFRKKEIEKDLECSIENKMELEKKKKKKGRRTLHQRLSMGAPKAVHGLPQRN
jgi:hypothetical protein